MSSNTSPLDQNVFDPQVAAEQREQRKRKIAKFFGKAPPQRKGVPFCWLFGSGDWPCICCLVVWWCFWQKVCHLSGKAA